MINQTIPSAIKIMLATVVLMLLTACTHLTMSEEEMIEMSQNNNQSLCKNRECDKYNQYKYKQKSDMEADLEWYPKK